VLKCLGSRLDGIEGRFVPTCVVEASSRTVSLKVQCLKRDDIIATLQLVDVVPACMDLIVLGTFDGEDAEEFESVVNGELQHVNFPATFSCDMIEVSEEGQLCIPHQVRLSGKAAPCFTPGGSKVPVDGSPNPYAGMGGGGTSSGGGIGGSSGGSAGRSSRYRSKRVHGGDQAQWQWDPTLGSSSAASPRQGSRASTGGVSGGLYHGNCNSSKDSGSKDTSKDSASKDSSSKDTSQDSSSKDSSQDSSRIGSGPVKVPGSIGVGPSGFPLFKEAAVIEERIVKEATSACKRIGRSGWLVTATSTAGHYTVIPTDHDRVHNVVAKFLGTLMVMLKTHGPKRLLSVLHETCNPVGKDSLRRALYGDKISIYLRIQPELELCVEARKEGNDEVKPSLEGRAVGIRLVPVPSTDGGRPTATSLVCLPMDPSPFPGWDEPYMPPPGAVLALHVDAEALLGLGLRPPPGHTHFYLKIAHLYGQDFSHDHGGGHIHSHGHSHGHVNGGGGSMQQYNGGHDVALMHHHPQPPMQMHVPMQVTVPVAMTMTMPVPVHVHGMMPHYTMHPLSPQQMCAYQGMAMAVPMIVSPTHSPGMHPHAAPPMLHSPTGAGPTTAMYPCAVGGDWVCPTCAALVFSYRPDCYKCHTARPVGSVVTPRQPPRNHGHPDGEIREGDWMCVACNGHNFATKLACFWCRAPRPEHTRALTPTTEGCGGGWGHDSERHPHSVRVLHGDWTCPNCQDLVFAKRTRCYRCSTPKPQ